MRYKIEQFLRENKVCVLSTNEPYSASVFYHFYEGALLFISSPNSRHIRLDSPYSAAIYTAWPIRGVSITGALTLANEEQKKSFLKRYPQARFALKHEIYALKISYAKYTDNALMLPKKTEIFYE